MNFFEVINMKIWLYKYMFELHILTLNKKWSSECLLQKKPEKNRTKGGFF